MLHYELKIALRKLLKSKLYSSLNIVGLAVGLAACLIIATIVLNDLSYDKQWKNSNLLYKIIGVQSANHGIEETPNVYSGLGPALVRSFPQVKSFCRMEVEQEKIKFDVTKDAVDLHALLAENTIWDMLDFTIIQGNPRQIREGIDNLIITRQLKDEYYKNDNPIGKIIYKIGGNDTTKYLITGVIENIPENTHLRSQVIVLRDYLGNKNSPANKFSGGSSPAVSPQYVLLSPHTNAALFEKKLNTWYKAQCNKALSNNSYHLQPMQDVYLRSNYADPGSVHGNIDTVYVFSLVAALILLVACINYVNLSTAKGIERMREAAVSRVVGAETGHIISRFLLDAMLFFIIAFIIAIGFYSVSVRFVQEYLNNVLPVTLFNSIALFGISFFSLLFVCVVTGLYPAYMLAKIKPVNALKGAVSQKPGMGILKRGLIVTQFAISLVVLIASITINLQSRFLKNADPGYDKNNLLQLGFASWGDKGDDFKKELLRIPGVESATRTNWYPAYAPGIMGIEMKDPRNENEVLHISLIQCDADFPGTLKLHLKSGRFFDPNRPSDATEDSLRYTKVLLSDTYVNIFKDESRLDRPVADYMHIPIGIVKDFHNESFLKREKPFIITAYKDIKWSAMLIRVTPGTNNRVITSLQKLWKQYYPAKTLSFNWVDDLLASEYRKESRLSNIFNIFTSLAILLACLGLFGLVTFTIEKRMKEIGIRKVLGASVASVSGLISKDFLTLLALGILIASPVAWYCLNRWLENYPYRINVYWWIFGLAAILMTVITLATLSFKTIKAAMANPVKSLRSE
ncbi:MAG TPA: FtsX-like permease family protein [Chitinophagaceae bacterium]|nr:FtsX-like permease family protein [Chitinophagaceae bacterium]